MKFETIDDLRNAKKIYQDLFIEYMELGDVSTLMDIFVSSVVHRAAEINEAFNALTNEEYFNFIAATPLLRLQIDNLLYCYAGTLTTDWNDLMTCFLSGQKWNTLKDVNGCELNEKYLLDKLCNFFQFEELKRIYKESSDYVHFSVSHLYLIRTIDENGNNTFTLGNSQPENKDDIISVMLGLNVMLVQLLVSHWFALREREIQVLQEYRNEYPDKSDAELFGQYAYGNDKVRSLLNNRLVERDDN